MTYLLEQEPLRNPLVHPTSNHISVKNPRTFTSLRGVVDTRRDRQPNALRLAAA